MHRAKNECAFVFIRDLRCFFAFFLLLAGCHKSGPPYTQAEAIKTFQIDPAFRVEPFASEHAVVSPVAMDFDEDGRIFVVENRGPKLGRVKLLEDTNGDGVPDRTTIFADNLTMPTGVMRWKKGILVTDAPDLLYFEDTDGDGKADIRRVVLTGFAVANPQDTVNSPVYGLDNWIYLANQNAGSGGSDLRFPDHPEVSPLNDRNHNVRFLPDASRIEALSGGSQFGQAFDQWGHHFTVANSDHIRHEVIAARYLKRNPDLVVPAVMAQISDHGGASEFTSAGGLVFFNGAMFVAEPAHNLVHEDVLFDAGATYLAKRAREGMEFLSSTDAWFHPVNLSTGPDGALYLMDLYSLTPGGDRGRIYRVAPRVIDSGVQKIGHPGSTSTRDLVHALESVNPWWRRTAQRLLIDRNEIEAAPELGRLVETSQSAVGRVHALWTLDGMKKLDVRLILKALDDAEPGVRENAIILAESRLAGSPELAAKLIEMVEDTSPKVRFQLLCTLGFLSTAEAKAARDQLLAHDLEDRWVQVAALSASPEEATRLFAKAVADWSSDESAGRVSLFRQVCSVIGERKRGPELQQVLSRVSQADGHGSAWWRTASLEGLAQGMRSSGHFSIETERPLLLTISASSDASVRRAALPLLEMAGLPPGRTSKP